MDERYFIRHPNGRFFANPRERHYNSADFCDDITFATWFSTERYARRFLEDYVCYAADGNTPVPLKVVKLAIVDA